MIEPSAAGGLERCADVGDGVLLWAVAEGVTADVVCAGLVTGLVVLTAAEDEVGWVDGCEIRATATMLTAASTAARTAAAAVIRAPLTSARESVNQLGSFIAPTR